MSEKRTIVRLPGQKVWSGLGDWGEQTAPAMIAQVRAYASHLRAQADLIDAAADSEFQIDVARGVFVQNHVREIQKSTLAKATGGAS